MTFDRLIYIDRLKEAGVSEPVARAHAEALRDAMVETVATEADLAEVVQAIRTDLQTQDGKIESMDRNIASMADKLDRKIESTADSLDRNIEITARDLTIKGASGLIIIASIIIGLKLFG